MKWLKSPFRFLLSLAIILSPILILMVVVNAFSGDDNQSSGNHTTLCSPGQNQNCKVPPALTQPPINSDTMTYSQVARYGQKKQISQALFAQTGGQAWVQIGNKIFNVAVPADQSALVADKLTQQGTVVRFLGQDEGGGGISWMVWVFALIILGSGISIFLIRKLLLGMPQSMGGMWGGEGSNNRPVFSMVRFKDVAGCDEVVEEVAEFVQFLKNPEAFRKTGARMPSGLILYGPPGTGKTLVAKAMAGEAHVPFFAVSGSDFVEKYVGVGASRVRELFQEARRTASGAIVFIDEVDAIGRRRGDEQHPERDQSLNALLTEMDGFSSNNRVVVIAATNRLDVIDPALLRPGRFSRQVQVGLPDQQGRLDILKIYAANKPLAPGVSLEDLAQTTAGCSGADLSDMINEAAIMAARESADLIQPEHLIEGQLRALAGPAKRRSIDPAERETIAYHEAGHVLTAELCQEHEKAQRASIRPRGQAGGLALYGQQDRMLHSARYLHEKIVCALGGRAAEWVKYGAVSSGAANDLQTATLIARQAVGELGFSPKAGQTITQQAGQSLHISDATRQVLDQEAERLVSQAYNEAVRLLEAHKEALHRLAQALLSAEEIDRLEIMQAIQGSGEMPDSSARAPVDLMPLVEQELASDTLRPPGESPPKTRTQKIIRLFKGRKKSAQSL